MRSVATVHRYYMKFVHLKSELKYTETAAGVVVSWLLVTLRSICQAILRATDEELRHDHLLIVLALQWEL